MAAPKRARRAASAISFILASLLVLGAAPANAAGPAPATTPSPVDPATTPAARFSVAEAATIAATAFTDVTPLTPLYNEINWMGTSGILKFGGNFGPAAGTNKGQFAAWLYKLAGSPAYTAPTATPFKDVPTTTAGYKEMAWADSKGILMIGSDKLYHPTALLTRTDVAVTLYRLAGKPVYSAPNVTPFKDVATTAVGYKEITWAASLGLAGGYSDRTYKPTTAARHDAVAYAFNKFVTRPQAVSTTAAALNVGPLGAGHASALVRLSVVKSGADASISVGGAPVLTVKAKTSGSTTVLVPLKAGTISVTSSAATSVSVDVLATFDGDAKTPGSTIGIAPVTRADTVKKLAADTLSPAAFPIGLTGSGGVPSTGVRAVYATATVTVPAARTLTLGDQKIAVPAGTSSTTTILVPKEDGTANAFIDSGTGSLRLDVRGYVPESSQNANSVNVAGSFVPAVKPTPQTVQVYGPGKASVTIPGVKDRSYALAMVSTTPSVSPLTAPSYLTLGSKALPGIGALVDPATGGQSQLVIVPAGTAATPLSVSAGSTKATITPVGDILSPTAGRADAAPTVKITSPANGSTVDLSKTGLVKLQGEIAGGSLSTSTVTISVAGAVIGTAVVRQTTNGAVWSFETRVAKSGSSKFDVKVTDRSGRTGAASVTINATVPAPTTTLVTPDAVVLDPTKPALAPAAVTSTSVTFAQAPAVQPGKVIISKATAANPGGVLRRVTEVNKTASGWVATTAPAKVTDVISQANIDKLVPINTLTQSSVNTAVKPGPGDTAVTTVAGPNKAVVVKTATPAAAQRLLTESLLVDTSTKQTLSITSGIAIGTDKAETDISQADAATAKRIKAEIAAKGGASLEGSAELEVAVRFVLKITPRLEWGVTKVTVDEFSVVLATIAKGQGTVTLSGELEASVKKKIADVKFPPMEFMAGPVPVVVTSGMDITIEGKVAGKIAVKASFGGERKQDFGFRYTDAGGLKNATSVAETKSTAPSFTPQGATEAINGKIEGSVGPTVEFNMSLWDTAGPTLTAGFQVGGEGETTFANALQEKPEFEFAPYIEGSVKVGVKFKVPIINERLLDYTILETKMKWALADPKKLDYLTMFPGHKLPPMGLANVTSITGSQDMYYGGFAMAAQADGTVLAWGSNSIGQLGDGTTVDRLYPQVVKGITNAKSVMAGGSGYILKKDGTVWQVLKDGVVQVPNLTGITSLATTSHTYYALKSDGTVWSWGFNGNGELGLGSNDYKLGGVPAKVVGLTSVKAIAANQSGRYPGFAYALKTDGTVWAWGYGSEGQMGDGAYSARYLPVQVKGVSGATSVTAVSGGGIVSKTDGTVWAWGYNYEGILGQPVASKTYPLAVRVPGISGVAAVTGSSYSAYALKSDGTVLAWGSDGSGQLGTNGKGDLAGQFGSKYNPVPALVPITGVKALSGGMSGAYAVKNDGSTWAWGPNWHGDAGDGTTAKRATPVMVLRGP
jgi:alpha-tubulin suppressor-like RCC1 family protein